jgi:predicted Zn-dependent protease
VDVSALSAAELAALPLDTLSDAQTEEAYQAAVRLDARELAGKFAAALVKRSPRPERPDRYPWFAHLVQLALGQNDTTGALDYVNEGEKQDCEHNGGRRRNDYELRRGQLLAKRGDTEPARDVFQRLLERTPGELKVAGTAAEAMLGLKRGALAKQFAEHGLAQARAQNNRDSEGYFLELVEAAKKQGG